MKTPRPRMFHTIRVDKLRAMRLAVDMSQAAVAELLQVHPKTYSGYETGEMRIPHGSLMALCSLFDTTEEALSILAEGRIRSRKANKVKKKKKQPRAKTSRTKAVEAPAEPEAEPTLPTIGDAAGQLKLLLGRIMGAQAAADELADIVEVLADQPRPKLAIDRYDEIVEILCGTDAEHDHVVETAKLFRAKAEAFDRIRGMTESVDAQAAVGLVAQRQAWTQRLREES